MLASEYKTSKLVGYDIQDPSIAKTNSKAKRCNMTDRLRYTSAVAASYDGVYDILTFFDCPHDIVDPLGVAKSVHFKTIR